MLKLRLAQPKKERKKRWADAGGSEFNICSANQNPTAVLEWTSGHMGCWFIFVSLPTDVFALHPSSCPCGSGEVMHATPLQRDEASYYVIGLKGFSFSPQKLVKHADE